jgi:hypothetical protein
MMDLHGDILAINNAPDRIRARRLRRQRRKAEVYQHLGAAIGRTRAVEAAASWALQKHDPEVAAGRPIGSQHPGLAAVAAVRTALSEFSLPTTYETRYLGMNRLSGRGASHIDDGVLTVEVTLHSLSGIDRALDVPVIVKEGRVLEPVCIVDQNVIRAMTQQTFDDIMSQLTFTAKIPDRRTMFSPPPETRHPAREVPLVRPGMFGLAPVNRQLTAAYVQSAVRGHYVTELPSFSAMRAEAPDHTDVGERPPPSIAPGDKVELSQAVDVVGRDGQRWHVDAGTSGQVQRDMCGDGKCYYVFFPDLGFSAVVRGDSLSAA